MGITGPSHAVIHNLIDEVCAARRAAAGSRARIGQRADRTTRSCIDAATMMTYDRLEQGLRDGELDIAAGTVWLWARGGLADSVDTLFVDEAGQMSLANVLAVAGAARNLVLLGDPQQLAQPSQAAHPPGAGASALEHVLGERATMPDGRRAVPRPDLPDAPGPVPVYLGGLLRREAARRATGSSGRRSWARRRASGVGPARRRGAAQGQHERLAGGGRARWRGWRASCAGCQWRDQDGVGAPVSAGRTSWS